MGWKSKEEKAEYDKKYRQEHKEELAEYYKQYYQKNKEKKTECDRQRRNTIVGKGKYLRNSYIKQDRVSGRISDELPPNYVTVEDVVRLITKSCAHCGETDWHKIGLNRLDNSLPHTIDNVEPCCKECNCKLYGVVSSKMVYQYTLDGELVAVWNSATEAAKELGLKRSPISACCRGYRYHYGKLIHIKSYNGYRWSYVPL